jgi:ribosome-associated toxin RatA of RatAB toxin-antitoxin module
MAGAEQSIIINAPPQAIYDVIVDYERYPEFLSEVESIKILKRNGNVVDVEYTVNVIKRVSYILRLTGTPHTSVRWSLVKASFMKSNEGGWALEDLGDGRTKATYGLQVKVSRLVPGRVVDKLAGSTLPATLQAFKERAEASQS